MKTKMNFSVFLLALTLTFSAAFAQAQSQTLYPVQIAGDITAYQRADCGNSGSITIAGITLKIAPGVDVIFGQNNRVIIANGQINSNGFGRSEPWEVIGTRRLLNAYVNSDNVIQYAPKFANQSNSFSSVQAVSVGTTTTAGVTVTGRINSLTVNSIQINGLTFPLAVGTQVDAVPGSQIVLVSGSFGGNNQLNRVSVSNTPYRNSILSGTLNPLNRAAVRYYLEPLAFTVPTSEFICDPFPAYIDYGFTTLIFAPDFNVSAINSPRFVGLEVVVDQFGLATTGTRQINRGESVVCGVVETFVPPPIVSEPTTLSEAAQRGRLVIGGISMTIGPNEKITGAELVQTGRSYCVYPEYNTFAEAPVAIVPGQLGLTRAFQLVTGSRIVPQ